MSTTNTVPTSTPATTTTRKNLNYVSRACDFCKGRHKKCDGGRPCFACKQRNRTCVYSQKVKKRGPKPKTKTKSTLKRSSSGVEAGLPSEASTDNSSSPEVVSSENSKVALAAEKCNPTVQTLTSTGSSSSLPTVKKEDLKSSTKSLKSALFEQINKQRNSWKRKVSSTSNENIALQLNTMMTVLTKELPWYPFLLPLHPSKVEEYWRIARAPVHGSSEEQLANSFLYCSIFAHGSRLVGNETMATEFANKSFIIMNQLFLTHGATHKEDIAERILQALILFIPFAAANNQSCRARAAIMHAFTLCNSYRDILPPTLVHRVYVHMVGISASLHDREHWLFMANRLGSRAATLENRLVMALMLTFSINETCGSSFLVAYPEDTTSELMFRHYIVIMQYLNECEEFSYYIANVLSFGPNLKYDHNTITSFQAVIFSCKCYIQSLFDNNTNFIAQYAQHAISLASSLTEPTAPVIICLAQVLKVLQEYNYTILSTEGLTVLCLLAKKVAYCNRPFENSFTVSPDGTIMYPKSYELCSSVVRALCSAPSPLSFSTSTLQFDGNNVPTPNPHITSGTHKLYQNSVVGCPLDPLFSSHPDLMMLDDPMDHRHQEGTLFISTDYYPLEYEEPQVFDNSSDM